MHSKLSKVLFILLLYLASINCKFDNLFDNPSRLFPSGTSNPSIRVLDTDFSKGRLIHKQTISLDDLVKFHGHKCDGLVLGFLALQYSFQEIFPDGIVDRTNLRIVSKSGPCISDAAIYLTGGRYQFNTFYVSNAIPYTYIIQKIDSEETWGVRLKPGVFSKKIGTAGKKAVAKELNSCELKELKNWEDEFSEFLLKGKLEYLYILEKVEKFDWKPELDNSFIKTDVINKDKEACNE
ncbi:MAG: formylmethanofuran dehydrogenase subunit E family protein [Leptospira sp.]|nr:formylmethanofuran dehydrogenase subunit E family protein [Leptospira sp.]